MPVPNVAQLDGDRVFTFERIGDGDEDYEVAVYDPCGASCHCRLARVSRATWRPTPRRPTKDPSAAGGR
jgi:hypothetical protein